MTFLGKSILVSLLAVAPALTFADEVSYKVTTYLTKLDVKPVGDVDGHVSGTWQRRGLCVYANDEIGVYVGNGTVDTTKGKGVAKGESTCTMPDGSSATIRWSVSIAPGAKGLAVYSDGTGEYVAGTGRWAGIQGKIAFTGAAYTPYKEDLKGDVVMTARGTYTLARR